MSNYLTSLGKIVLGVNVLFLVGSIHLDTPVYLLSGAGLSLLLVAAIASRAYRPKLSVHTEVPPFVATKRPFPVWVNVKNLGTRTCFDVGLRFAVNEFVDCTLNETEIHRIDVGKSDSKRIQMVAKRRGIFSLPAIETRTSFPLNLSFVSATHPVSASIAVVPDFKPIASLNRIIDSSGLLAGEHAICRTEGVDEYIGAREYLPGMSTKRWDHRAWARLGKPHVLQFERENNARVWLALDLTRCERDEICEAAISLLLAIASELAERSLVVAGLSIGGSDVTLSGDPTSQRNEIAVSLAGVSLNDKAGRRTPEFSNQIAGTVLVVIPVDQRGSGKKLPHSSHRSSQVLEILVSEESQGSFPGFQVSVEEIARGAVCL